MKLTSLPLLRREFITLLGVLAAAWPLAARAQLADRIGVLMTLSENDQGGQARLEAFRQALQGFGWVEGRKSNSYH